MNHDRLAWPILLLLLTVLVPSIGVVWMMREAIRNERLASNHRLKEAYQVQLQSAAQTVNSRWAEELQRSSQTLEKHSPAYAFAKIVLRGDVDAVLIRDAAGKTIYPEPEHLTSTPTSVNEPRWDQAEQLEFLEHNYDSAAEIYAQLTEASDSTVLQSRARQSRVRCLLKLDRQDEAIEVLQSQRRPSSPEAPKQSSYAAFAELRLLELLKRDSESWREIVASLSDRLNDYHDDALASSQRLFLMNQLQQVTDNSITWPTHEAETLANEAVMIESLQKSQSRLQATALPDVWCRASPDGRIVELYRTETVRRRLLLLAGINALPSGVSMVTSAPNESSSNHVDVTLGTEFGGWRLGMSLSDQNLLDEASQQQRTVHVWIALLVIAVTFVFAWLLLRALRQRLRLAQLKNDLVATVSHELKTPLSSIRLLVDTLLANPVELNDGTLRVQSREYLQMIGRENARLTRLIDNFLTYSRMQYGHTNAQKQKLDMREIVNQATVIFREHAGEVDKCLVVPLGPPAIVIGDADFLVAAVVNLLENAWKYSSDPRRITVSTHAKEDLVFVEVSDNGIGMNARAMRLAFDPFFQVDQRVSRTRGGCGLGLSIVRAIMRSHGGEVRVASTLGAGSTFTLSLPNVGSGTTQELLT